MGGGVFSSRPQGSTTHVEVTFKYLDVDIKYTLPKAVKRFVISEYDLGKVQANPVVSVQETISIVCKGEGRHTCRCV